MHVFISMALAVLIWGSYPLGAVISLKTMSSLELIFMATFFSSLGVLILGMGYLLKRKRLNDFINYHKKLDKAAYGLILASGVTNFLCHGLFFIALTMSHKGGISLLYESWPIFAVIATPFLIKKEWRDVGFKEFLVSLIALFGVAVVILSNQNIDLGLKQSNNLSEPRNYMSLLGYALALVGAYLCAMCVVLKGVVAQHFRPLNDDIGATVISEFYSRMISFILVIITMIFLQTGIDLEAVNWQSSFYVGFVVMVLGGVFYTYGLIKTDRPTIHILYYFVPILAVIFLWMAGETPISTGLFSGGLIIVLCNIYLYFAGRDAKTSVTL